MRPRSQFSSPFGCRGAGISARRLFGAVVLALVAHQAAAQSWSACELVAAQNASVGMTGMDGMTGMTGMTDAHLMYGGSGVPPASEVPSAPEPAHGSDCDHSLPASGCSLSPGCAVIAVPVQELREVRAIRSSGEPFSIAVGELREPPSAPDTPPPRT